MLPKINFSENISTTNFVDKKVYNIIITLHTIINGNNNNNNNGFKNESQF